jgi:hypothetical protein
MYARIRYFQPRSMLYSQKITRYEFVLNAGQWVEPHADSLMLFSNPGSLRKRLGLSSNYSVVLDSTKSKSEMAAGSQKLKVLLQLSYQNFNAEYKDLFGITFQHL